MKLTYEQYRKAVSKLAYAKYNNPVCMDTVKDNYENGASVEEAVDDVIFDSEFWDGKLIP